MDSWDILALQNIVYIANQSLSATIEQEAMKAENRERERRGLAPAHSYEAFMALIDKYQLHHNATITNLHNGR